jgi:hypothetical protein
MERTGGEPGFACWPVEISTNFSPSSGARWKTYGVLVGIVNELSQISLVLVIRQCERA